jgi:hypothetical protein
LVCNDQPRAENVQLSAHETREHDVAMTTEPTKLTASERPDIAKIVNTNLE